MVRLNPVIDGFEVKPAEKRLPQLVVVKSKKKGVRHFHKPRGLVLPAPSEPIDLLCGSGRKPQRLRKNGWEVEQLLFNHKVLVHQIDHVADFCQGCKAKLRDLTGLDLTGSFATYCSQELYSGQPIEDRFMLFASTNREKGSGAPVL